MLLIDNSNSMFDKEGIGSDPNRHRIEAAQMVINYLGIDDESAAHRVGVIFFGGKARLIAPLTQLTDETRRAELASLIAEPERMAWTDPAEALSLAHGTLVGEEQRGRRRVVILLTDGKPEWDGKRTTGERQVIIEDLRRIGSSYAQDDIYLFTLLLSNPATAADPDIAHTYAPLWSDLSRMTKGAFYQVDQADDLLGVYHDILVTLSAVQTEGPVLDVAVEQDARRETVTVEPDLARVTFLIHISHPDVVVELQRPDGRALEPQAPDVRHAGRNTTAIWTVRRPQAGEWRVLMDGKGTVTVWKDYQAATPTRTPTLTPSPSPTPTPQLIVEEWPEAILAGQPFTVSVAFVPRLLEPPAVQMEWHIDHMAPSKERLLDDGRQGDRQAKDGRYGIMLTPLCTGTLVAHVWGEVRGREVASWEGRLRVEPRPILTIVAPQEGATWPAGRPVTMRVRWAVPYDASENVDPVTATIRAADGGVFTIANGTVGDLITVTAPPAGHYTVTLKAQRASPGEAPASVQAMRAVTVCSPTRSWWRAAGIGLVLAGLGGWRLYRRQRLLPRVRGQLRVLESPTSYTGSTLEDLSRLNRRSVELGTGGVGLPEVSASSPWAEIRALRDGSGMELTPRDGQSVRVNGYVLHGPHLLSDGDQIAIDDIQLRYEHLL
jgi:hypothetical protein